MLGVTAGPRPRRSPDDSARHAPARKTPTGRRDPGRAAGPSARSYGLSVGGKAAWAVESVWNHLKYSCPI